MSITPEELQKALEEIREYIDRDVAAGFLSAEVIGAGALEVLADSYDSDELRSHVERITFEAMEHHRIEQASWLLETDCDRIDKAFGELERNGIVARQNFSCCGNCGSFEIWGEMERMGRKGLDVRGYTFFHMQDTMNAVDGCGLYLAYGSVQEGEAGALAVAREIVAVIEGLGFTVIWNGSWHNRILVELDWKKRRRI